MKQYRTSEPRHEIRLSVPRSLAQRLAHVAYRRGVSLNYVCVELLGKLKSSEASGK